MQTEKTLRSNEEKLFLENVIDESKSNLDDWNASDVKNSEIRDFFESIASYDLKSILQWASDARTLVNTSSSEVHSAFFNYCASNMRSCARDFQDLTLWMRKYFIVRALLAAEKQDDFEVLYSNFLKDCESDEVGSKIKNYANLVETYSGELSDAKATDVQIRTSFLGASGELFDHILTRSHRREHMATAEESANWIAGLYGATILKDLLEIGRKIRPIKRNIFELKTSEPVLKKYEFLMHKVNNWRDNCRALQLELARQTSLLYLER